MPSMPLKVSGGQLRIRQIGTRGTFDVRCCELDRASRSEHIPAVAENYTADMQRKVLYHIVTIDSIDAPGVGTGQGLLRSRYTDGRHPTSVLIHPSR